jgi:hypothetical protein
MTRTRPTILIRIEVTDTEFVSIYCRIGAATSRYILAGLKLSPKRRGMHVKKDVSVRELGDVLSKSGLVFRATVKKLRASSLASLPANPRTAICRVDQVIHAPEQIGDFTGKDVTLERKESESLKVGQRVVFFASGWLYGETIAVKEIERVQNVSVDQLKKRVRAAIKLNADNALRSRLAKAELVVSGRVSKVTRVESDTAQPLSFHHPIWLVAEVEVDSVEKGRTPERKLSVLFAASGDVHWISSPKFVEGQHGIWILQRDQQEKGRPSHRIPGLTALDPLDFHSKDELERIRKLAKKNR